MGNKQEQTEEVLWERGIDPNLMSIFSKPIESKATAMQYALDSTVTYENGNKVFHTDKAKEIYDFICANVVLPEAPLIEFLKELNKSLDEFRSKLPERKSERD